MLVEHQKAVRVLSPVVKRTRIFCGDNSKYQYPPIGTQCINLAGLGIRQPVPLVAS